jgi:hypothetical protein
VLVAEASAKVAVEVVTSSSFQAESGTLWKLSVRIWDSGGVSAFAWLITGRTGKSKALSMAVGMKQEQIAQVKVKWY